jgi:hypothetical protein
MTEKYSSAQVFSDLTTLNLASYEGDFAFGQRAVRIAERPEGAHAKSWPARYRIETESGAMVYAETLVLAPGFGKERYPFKDPEFLRLIREEEKKPLPKLQSGDALLARANRISEEGKNPLDAIPVDEVFVVGEGHGGNIVVEFLRGLAPKAAYGDHPVRPKRVVWIGQKSKNGTEFKQKVRDEFDAPKWTRYDELGDELDRGGIESLAVRLSGGRKIALPDGTGGYELELLHPDGTATKRIARAVVFSTGYESTLGPLLKTLAEDFELRPVMGRIDSDSFRDVTAIGKQVFSGAEGAKKAHAIYVSGPAAAPLATPQELAESITHNPVSINVLGLRTQALVKALVPPTRRASRLMPGATDAGVFLREILVPRIAFDSASDFRSSAYESEVHLIRVFTRFSLPEKVQVDFRWREAPGGSGRLVVGIHGLDTPSSRRLARAIERNSFLIRSLSQAFEDDTKSAIRFTVLADPSGRALDTQFTKIP